MGLLIDGKWHDQWYDTTRSGGRFERSAAAFRNWVTADGSPGPSGKGGFRAEPNRYHLYVSLACPWAHRTLIYRRLKGLEPLIGVSVVDWFMAENGWTFEARDGATGDRANGMDFLWQVYVKAMPDCSGRVTVPVLFDLERQTIVSNESSEIIRMFDHAFDGLRPESEGWQDMRPAELASEIDSLNQRIYEQVNNGVYRCGFATTQSAYEEAFRELFGTLDWIETTLARRRYLCGARITEADWRLFTTLIRFDAVYFGHFKCNLRRIEDYPHLSGYLRELYQIEGIAETVNLHHIKHHYYHSHRTINPHGIVPLGPELALDRPHGREAAGHG